MSFLPALIARFSRFDRDLARRVSRAFSARQPMDAGRKSAMRAFLAEYAAMQPVRQPHAAQRSVSVIWYGAQMRIPAFMAAVLFLFTGGTAYAAQEALPGDPLYGFKVNVNETLEGALAVSPQAKADWAVERANRRLEEASTLAAAGKLTPSAAAQVQQNIDSQVPAAAEKTKQLEDSSGGIAAVAANAKLAATLSAHADILTALSQDIPDKATRDQLHAIVATVITQQREASAEDGASLAIIAEPASSSAAASAHTALMMAPATAAPMHAATLATVSTTAQAAATGTQPFAPAREGEPADPAAIAAARAAASVQIAAASQLLEGTSSTTDAYAKARQRLDAAHEAFADGRTALAASSTADALVQFDRALANAVAAQAYFSATRHFLRISSMLEGMLEIRSGDVSDQDASDTPPNTSATTAPAFASSTPSGAPPHIPAGWGGADPTGTTSDAEEDQPGSIRDVTHDLEQRVEDIATTTVSSTIRLPL